MKATYSYIFKSGVAGLTAMSLVVACGVKEVKESPSASVPGRHNTTDDSGQASEWPRLCSKPVLFSNKTAMENALEQYFFSTMNGAIPQYPGEVRDVEPPVNWCLRVSSNRAAFRIEYEDHYGGGWYELDAAKSTDLNAATTAPILFHSSMANNKIDLIFLDSQGFTQIIGTKANDGYYTATLKFANLPSQADYIASYVQSQVNKCKSGEWTVAMCWGYNFPPTYQQTPTDPLTMARGMLNGGSGAKAYTIGTMRFLASDILN